MFILDIDPESAASVQRAMQTEWLLTNGLGGYAMGTALGVNTRRYHGLIIAALQPPVQRILALHSTFEQLIIDDEVFDLTSQQFGNAAVLHPQGWRYLQTIRFVPNECVEWQYQIGRIRVTKTLNMLSGRNGITLQFTVEGLARPAKLQVRPFTPLRDFHGLLHEPELRCEPEMTREGVLRFQCGDAQMQWFGHARKWRHEPQWWRQFAYAHDQIRGQAFLEDQWSAGYFDCDIPAGGAERIGFALSVDRVGQPLLAAPRVTPKSLANNPNGRLKMAADQFIVQRHVGDGWSTSVIAGYPWFVDWGRDTMISLPGLMLCTGRTDEAHATLLTFARSMHHGLVPNLFDDYGGGIGGAHYNTVDASLWFVHAVHELWKKTRAVDPELLGACEAVLDAYREGTDFDIRMDDDGLIAAGDESSQLTWMDAKRDGVVFTARHGKAVEINALWFNAINGVASMCDRGARREDLLNLADRVSQSFQEQFWWEAPRCLHDVLLTVEGAGGTKKYVADDSLRPNQIFAASLPFSPLSREQRQSVVKAVGDHLLTRFGLRTLASNDHRYRGRYEGNLFERDRAYHNGTVWPWLIGPYGEALLRCEDFSAAARKTVRTILQPLLDEMTLNPAGDGRCMNQIAEVYDGDPPHRPGGCPAQSWSVAEVLRLLSMLEDRPTT